MASMVHGTTSDDNTAYRALPSLDRLLAAAPGLVERHGRRECTDALRRILADARQGITGGQPAPDSAGLLDAAARYLDARAAPRLKRVFNLTGTVLHTNLGRAVLPDVSLIDMFTGYGVLGCIGEVSVLALLIGFAWLLFRRVISWRIPVAYVGAVAVLTLIFYKGDNALAWMLYSVMGGGVMLGAIFMATDYVTSPAMPAAQLVYGVGCGVLTVIFRYFGLFPEGVTYAILIMNACAWALDKAVPVKRFGVKGGAGK